MIENEIIEQAIMFFQALALAGGAFRLAYCGYIMQADTERMGEMKKRIINVIAYIILAEAVLALMTLILGYFGGTP